MSSSAAPSGQTALRGITWSHTRGFLPMVATAQRFQELHPDVSVQWSLRSLQSFADQPIAQLAREFDLLVLDHPSIGAASADGILVPLESLLDSSFLADQAAHSVGASHRSYAHAGSQWALAIDAATPISGWREDLLQRAGFPVPQTWLEVLELARHGLVALPGVAIDALMHLYMLCAAVGEQPFLAEGRFVNTEVGVAALRHLRELHSLCSASCFTRNPIRTWELLSSGDTIAYCPFAYGYSNYCRNGYAQHTLTVGNLVAFGHAGTLRSTLGGAGLAISSACRDLRTAAQYAAFVADPLCQRTLYFESGGQPGHRIAWLDPETNRRSNNFFLRTLDTLDQALLRPRFNGYLHFQDHAAPLVQAYLINGGSEKELLLQLESLFQSALTRGTE